jgi:hypothetical protein
VSCPGCGEAAAVVAGASADATVGTVAARVERRPVVDCAARHGITPPELVGEAMAAVDAAVPRARARLLRTDVCLDCRDPLTMPVRRAERAVTVEPTDGPVTTIHLDVPLTRCGSCGRDQVPSRSHEDLTVVIPALFAAR